MVEFAILAPILIVLVLWSNYFWEVQFARIKAAEAVRFVAFERTVRPDLNAIIAEAQDRYQDLDGTTKGATIGSYYRNKITVFARAEAAPAPLNSNEGLSDKGSSAGVGSIIGAVVGALGGTAGAVAQKMGLDPNQGAVKGGGVPAPELDHPSGDLVLHHRLHGQPAGSHLQGSVLPLPRHVDGLGLRGQPERHLQPGAAAHL